MDDIQHATCVDDSKKHRVYSDVLNAAKRATSDAHYLFPTQADYNIKHAIGDDAENRKVYDEGVKAESRKQSELETQYLEEVAKKNSITMECLNSILFEFHQQEAKALGLPYN